MSIRLAIVEDHAPTRRRMAQHLGFFEAIEVSLTCPSGVAFLKAMGERTAFERPQVVLMDIQMPGLSGIETTRRLKVAHPEIEVLMFTVFDDDERIFDAIQAGASGYLLKDDPVDQIVDAIKELEQGGAPISAAIARKVLTLVRRGGLPQAAPQTSDFELSDREIDVLRLVVAGKTNREIAEELFLSPLTVKTHVKNMYKKLHVHSRASAVQVALRHDLLE